MQYHRVQRSKRRRQVPSAERLQPNNVAFLVLFMVENPLAGSTVEIKVGPQA
jgi:hypothetical protein